MNLYKTIEEKRVFRAASFLWGTPTYVGDVAEGILELCLRKITGLFHIVGRSFVNRLEWAREACRILELNNSLLLEMKEPPEDFVPRPLKCSLSTKKFETYCSTPLHNVVEGLQLMKTESFREKT
jgi:dTDP-4-dehydrorhamnose reductase